MVFIDPSLATKKTNVKAIFLIFSIKILTRSDQETMINK